MLVIQPLTPLPKDPDNDALLEAFTIVHEDAKRDRGHLRELVGAEKQREHSQDEIDRQLEEAAQIVRAAIEEANQQEVKIKVPFWKRFGL